MFGCLGRIGCLVVVLCVAAAAWITRDRWLHIHGAPSAATSSAAVWEPLTDAGAARARTAVESLTRKQGPVFANVRAGDLASYVFVALQHTLPQSAQDTRAAVIGDRLYVKSLVSIKDFGGAGALGPLGSFLSDRDTLTFGGRFELVKPGLAQYRIEELKFGSLSVPQAMIPKLVSRMRKGGEQALLAPNGLALSVPVTIGDVRVGKGQVTLYKTQ